MTDPRNSPAPAWLGPLARPAARIYRQAVVWRNARLDRATPTRVPVPVISVGNISAGGTGKTPVVSFLASRFIKAGRKPIIALRGYKAHSNRPSDETVEHAQRLPDAVIATGADRVASITRCLERNPQCDMAVLDDGFQHRRIHRDFDLVLIDATRPPFDDDMLPLGFLREPVSALARCNAIALTRCEQVEETKLVDLENALRQSASIPIIARLQTRWERVQTSDQPAHQSSADILSQRRVLVLCGIGNPRSFEANCVAHGAHVVDRQFLPDHVRYTQASLQQVIDRAVQLDADVLTTHKDWVKIQPLIANLQSVSNFIIPLVDIEPVAGFDALWEAMSAAVQSHQP